MGGFLGEASPLVFKGVEARGLGGGGSAEGGVENGVEGREVGRRACRGGRGNRWTFGSCFRIGVWTVEGGLEWGDWRPEEVGSLCEPGELGGIEV